MRSFAWHGHEIIICYTEKVVFSWLYPQRCFSCQQVGSYLCSACQAKLKPVNYLICPGCGRPSPLGLTHPSCQKRTPLQGLISVFKYNYLIRTLIHKFKYRFIKDLGEQLAQMALTQLQQQSLFKPALKRLSQLQPVLVPIPLYWWRFNWRGFNQAEILTQALAQAWHWPLRSKDLKRVKFTQPQAKLTAKKRQKNLNQAFKASYPAKTKTVVLVDDVWTTGATMQAAAQALNQAGVKTIWALTLAQ